MRSFIAAAASSGVMDRWSTTMALSASLTAAMLPRGQRLLLGDTASGIWFPPNACGMPVLRLVVVVVVVPIVMLLSVGQVKPSFI